ncbi:MAG: radical SAM protein [Defluviitaleaceae bacterium]|nr:radical SAM protein [Defluviitaleaceae bacterium]
MNDTNVIDIIFVDDVNTSTHPYTEMAVVRAGFHEMGYKTDIHFFSKMSQDVIKNVFKERKPKYILGTFNYPEAETMLKILEYIKLTYEDVLICIASPFIDIYAEQLLQDYYFLDYAILGEPNQTSLELFKCLLNKLELTNCKGIVYRNEQSRIVKNEPRPYVENINNFPIADRSHQKLFNLEYVEILKSRGCTGTCSFCNFHSFRNRQPGSYFRIRSANDVVDEIQEIQEKSFGMKYKFFMGDFSLLEANNQAIDDLYLLAREIQNRNLKIVVHFSTRAELINQETAPLLKELKRAGVNSILVGFESMDCNDLKLYKKLATPDDNINAMNILRELDIELFPSFILFNPLTDENSLKKNFDFLYESGFGRTFNWYRSHLQVHPETSVVDLLIKEGLLQRDFDYLNIRNQIKWKNSYAKTLLNAFNDVDMSARLHRNQIRVFRLSNVVRNRLPEKYQDSFLDIIEHNKKLAAQMNEEHYEMACKSLSLAINGATEEQLHEICRKLDFSIYDEEYEKLKMMIEVKFERVRKYLI